jgi:hypothetical protein
VARAAGPAVRAVDQAARVVGPVARAAAPAGVAVEMVVAVADATETGAPISRIGSSRFVG